MTTSGYHIILRIALIVLTVTCLSLPAHAAGKGDMPTKLEERWSRIGSEALIDKGIAYVNRDMPDSALLCFSVVANRRFLNNKKDSVEWMAYARSLNDMGALYHDYYYDFQKSQLYYQQALDIAEEHELKDIIVVIYNNLAALDLLKILLYPEKDTPDSLLSKPQKAFQMGVAYKIGEHDLAPIIWHLVSKAVDLDAVNQIQDELHTYLQLTDTTTAPVPLMTRQLCISVLAYDNGNNAQAIESIGRAEQLAQNVNQRDMLQMIKFQILCNAGEDEQALKLIKEAEQMARERHRDATLLDVYGLQKDYYQRKGNQSLAAKYELLYLRQKDSLINQSKLVAMNNHGFLMQIDEMNEHAKELAYENKLKERMLWGIMIFAMVLAALLVLLMKKYRQVQENYRQLYEKNLAYLNADEQCRTMMLEQDAQVIRDGDTKLKYRNNAAMDQETQSALLHRVIIVMETSDEVYDNKFDINRLAELVDSSSNLVSQVINAHYGYGFRPMLNDYRIKEACRRMNDVESYGNQTIEAIANSVGFQSYPNFVTNFKKFTGLTPSVYQRQARERGKSK